MVSEKPRKTISHHVMMRVSSEEKGKSSIRYLPRARHPTAKNTTFYCVYTNCMASYVICRLENIDEVRNSDNDHSDFELLAKTR